MPCIKRGNTKNCVTTENAAEIIKTFYRRDLNYSADEINVLVEWEIYDMQEDEDNNLIFIVTQCVLN